MAFLRARGAAVYEHRGIALSLAPVWYARAGAAAAPPPSSLPSRDRDGGMGRVRTYHYSTRLTDRRPGWMGLWSVEDQWGRVIDVVLQYEVHREAVGPPLPSGEVINHNSDQYCG